MCTTGALMLGSLLADVGVGAVRGVGSCGGVGGSGVEGGGG